MGLSILPWTQMTRCMGGSSQTIYEPGLCQRPTITAMLKEQRRTQDLEARRQIIFTFSGMWQSSSTMCTRTPSRSLPPGSHM